MILFPRVFLNWSCVCMLALAGCRPAQDPVIQAEAPPAVPGYDSIVFETPDDAVAALVAALRDTDDELLGEILGVPPEKILTGDEESDGAARQAFLVALQERGEFETTQDGWVVLLCGDDQWPFPFPLFQEQEGWRFLGKPGLEEIHLRTLGENELVAHSTLRGIVAAQNEFALQYGDGLYAERIKSSPGSQDGLYWASEEVRSPVGPGISAAEYPTNGDPYHGYFYRMVTTAERNDFHILAWPAEYARSGVMSFLIDRHGILYERDFGVETSEFAPVEEVTPISPEWQVVEVLNAASGE